MANRWCGGWAAKMAAAVFGLVVAGTAPAAIYVGTFDPQFGSPLTTANGPFDVGWRGTVTVDANAACLTQAASAAGLADVGVGGCAASISSASVVLYNMLTPEVDGATLNFLPSSFDVYSLLFDLSTSNLLHLSSSFSAPVSTTYTEDFPGGGPFGPFQHFTLQFLLDSDLNECDPFSSDPCTPLPYSGPALWVDTSDFECMPGETNCRRSNVKDFPSTLEFTPRNPVPEPAGLALTLTALAAAAAGTRRRRH